MRNLLLALMAFSAMHVSAQQQTTPQVCYELFVRAFADSNGDGIGDLNGITAKLDYLKDLGVDALWLTPVSPSPSYHKYDVVDYYGIDPECGTLDDYKRLIAEAHARGIKIIYDLVINHTSSKHPWFKDAAQGKNAAYRDYYVWLPPATIDSLGIAIREQTPDTWELNPWRWVKEGEEEKYYGLFSGNMPDLNYDNPAVRQEVYKIGRFWLQEVGVDGFRLDAAKHLYPDWEAPKCHAFWIEFRKEMEAVNPEVFIVGEVYTTAEKIAPYFQGLMANFDMDLHTYLEELLVSGHDTGLVTLLKHNFALFAAANPDFVNATLLSNHDQNRIGSALKGDPAMLKEAANLLLTLPGLPFLYYGEELGMLGAKPDEHIREPFLWGGQDALQTTWITKNNLSTEQTVAPLTVQMQDKNSLYHHYKTLIALRRSQPALVQVLRPNLEPVTTQPELLAFMRPHATGDLLVVNNVNSQPQVFTLASENLAFKKVVFASAKMNKAGKGKWTLPPYSMLILKR